MYVMPLCLLILLIPVAYSVFLHNASYNLYEVTAFNAQERSIVYSLYIKNKEIIFLNGVTNVAAIPMDVLVSDCCTYIFEKNLQDNYIEYTFIKKYSVPIQLKAVDDIKITRSVNDVIEITSKFPDWSDIILWVKQIQQKYSIIHKIVIGKTYEKRDIFVLKLSTGVKNSAVFIMGGEEGRDWLSPAIIMNYINHLLENNSKIETLLEYFELYFLPVFNPDGYEYSIQTDRFWAKNRKAFFPKKICSYGQSAVGVNIDRNWYLTKSSYTTYSECDSVYIGHNSLSEEEPQSVSMFLNKIAPRLTTFVNLKGFERLITVPYAYYTEYSNNYAILIEILSSTCEILENEHNVTYFYGNTGNFYYNNSGNSADWVKNKLNIPAVFTVSMKYKEYYLPYPEHIKPLTEEFSVITKKSLDIAKSIYGPLFGRQIKESVNIALTIITVSTILLLYYF